MSAGFHRLLLVLLCLGTSLGLRQKQPPQYAGTPLFPTAELHAALQEVAPTVMPGDTDPDYPVLNIHVAERSLFVCALH